MAGKSGGVMDTVKVGMRMFEVGMRFMNNLDKYSKNAQKIGKFFGKKNEPTIDAGIVEKPKQPTKRASKSDPLMDRIMEDKSFSEFLQQTLDKKTVFGGLADDWKIQQNLIEKYQELEAFETMGELRRAVKKLLGK